MPQIDTAGSHATNTRRNLIAGVRGRPFSEAAVDAVFEQAGEFLSRAVDAYEAHIAPGEVGQYGSAVASNGLPITEGGTTGLLYGRVQSGKTAAMIAAAALALDNGFRLIVVLTANNVTLVRQTANRFRALDGATVLSTSIEGGGPEWEGLDDELAEDLRDEGLVLVCAKETVSHLPSVMRLLQEINAADFPALVFDDEADAATPDTTLAARSAGRPNAPEVPSTTHRQIIENVAPGQEGESIREVLPHHVFVQVTATPYILFLQSGDSPLRPKFVHLLEPGEGYCGGEAFFGSFDEDAVRPEPPIVLVPDNEAQLLTAARRQSTPPVGLQAAVKFFLLGATAHSLLNGGRFPDGGYKFLAHTSPRQVHHTNLADVIVRFTRAVARLLRPANRAAAARAFLEAYEELGTTEAGMPGGLPALDELLDALAIHLGQREIVTVNANTGAPHYGPTYNFVVGGNILGRGVTIDDLLVTYYLREAQVSQMDTVWQHARMYGYRERLMPFTRVYLPKRLAVLFRGIHESEEELRAVLPLLEVDSPVPLQVVTGTRPTRPNALQPSAIRVYVGGRQVRPRGPVTIPNLVHTADQEIRARLTEWDIPTGEGLTLGERLKIIEIEKLIELVELVPVNQDETKWDPAGVVSVLRAVRDGFGGVGYLYVRPTGTKRGASGLPSGAITGAEQQLATDKPMLALVFRDGSLADVPPFWFPTLVLPPDNPPLIFNAGAS